MTGNGLAPRPADGRRSIVDERERPASAVEPAIKEDAKGSVSSATRKRINDAVASFRAKFLKNSARLRARLPGRPGLLHHPGQPDPAAQRPEHEGVPGQARGRQGADRRRPDRLHELPQPPLRAGHFRPADRDLHPARPALIAIRDEPRPETLTASAPDQTGENLRSAARDAFKGMSWDQLEAHRLSR